MDTVLDRFGNKLQVTMYCYPAKMWVVCDDDKPVACLAISMVNGVGVEWEDEEYKGYDLLNCLRNADGVSCLNIKGKKYLLFYHEADYFVGISYPNEFVTGCVAIKSDGEMLCRWRSPLIRGSSSSLVWAMCSYSKILERKYLPKGVTKIFGVVNANNVISNRYHLSVGANFVGKVGINGVIFNKYEQDILDIVEQASKLRPMWESNNIGDFDNPSVLIQDEVYVG